jgi:hypothetical protein
LAYSKSSPGGPPARYLPVQKPTNSASIVY